MPISSTPNVLTTSVPPEIPPLPAQPDVVVALANELALTGHRAPAATPAYSLGSHADRYVPSRFYEYIVHFCQELTVRKVLHQGHLEDQADRPPASVYALPSMSRRGQRCAALSPYLSALQQNTCNDL
jgi:hypothetical protein